MFINYFKRYKMEINLDKWTPDPVQLPTGYEFIPWTPQLNDAHGQTIFDCFRQSIDAKYFITFTQLSRCKRFMHELSSRPNFLEETTWLIVYQPDNRPSDLISAGLQKAVEITKTFTFHKTLPANSIAAKLVNSERVGTIQGILRSDFTGGIQNVGITPNHRGKGLSHALLLKSLEGFKNAGLNKVDLEVTAENLVAIKLYQETGFRVREIVNKAASIV